MNREELLEKGEPVLGFEESKELASEGEASLIVTADNCPQSFIDELEETGVTVERFDGDSRELGVAFGKPFNVAVAAFPED